MTISSGKLTLLLLVAVFFAYFSSLTNPFIWDDEQFITSNVYVQHFVLDKIFTQSTTAGAGVTSNYYRPVTTLSFAIDSKIWSFGSTQDKGMNTFGFHLNNLMLHAGVGILLFFFLLELGIGQLWSFFIALIFLIHPVQTEAVSYINSRGDSLYALFLFASLFLFFRALSQKGILLYIEVLGLYALSIFSKEIAVAAFPLFFVLIFLHMLRQKVKHLHTYKMPLLTAGGTIAIVAVYVLLRLTALNFANTLNYYPSVTFYSTHLLVRIYTFARVLWVYLGILLWPNPLHMERNVSLVYSFFSWEVFSIMLLTVVLFVVAVWEIRKKSTGFILFGLALSSCLLLPVSGIIPINGMLYEHWLYVPIIGFLIILYGIWKLCIATRKIDKILISFALLLSILYIFLTIRQNNIWSDSAGFYRYTLQFAPDSARLHNNLGLSLANAGDTKDAITEYKKALALGQGYPQIYNNLGNAQMAVGDYQDAEKNLTKAFSLAPNFFVARNNLIKLYLLTKQYEKALVFSRNNPSVVKIIEELKSQP